ncbi:MAG: hypothetical protein Q8O88_02660 [bacterium]|nr:hypothetical protein [bacterium]
MRKKLLSLSIILLIQFQALNSFAQEKSQNKKSYFNNVTFNFTRLLLNEARFGYEYQLTERHVLRANLGIQYPTSSESFESVSVVFGNAPKYYKVSNGIYFGVGYNYILGTRSKIYVSAEAYFNFNHYDKKYYKYSVGTDMDSYVSLQSMKLKKTGLKLLIGKKVSIISGGKVGLELDFFAGFGLQYRNEEITVYEKRNGSSSYEPSELNVLNPPEIQTNNNWYPTLNAGILICMPF